MSSGFTEADEYLRKQDPVLRGLIDAQGPIDPAIDRRGSRPDAYIALARAIVGQQVSTKAAASIWAKFEEALGGDPSPEAVVEAETDLLRGAGLSGSKAAYVKDLAGHVVSGELDLDRISELSDEDVVADLTEIKGIGRWTAEMFLIFHLGRPDVISAGDLGIRRAIEIAYGLDDLPGPTDLERISDPWRPQRTLACLYLWRSLDKTPA
ncbi:MAG TPA: DNA-3-methyladenine glycosylase [Solirubrobacterales bacterium]